MRTPTLALWGTLLTAAAVACGVMLGPAVAQDAINLPLSRMVAEDQEARRAQPPREQWPALEAADAARRMAVRRMLAEGLIRAPLDYENAALIMQHGRQTEDYRLAHALATVAVTMGPERRFARWLQAASWDRMMLAFGKLQWYGTQRRSDADGRLWVPPVDPDVPDEHRVQMQQPPLRQTLQQAP